MWLPCDCADKLQQTSAAYGLEEVWEGQAGCSCYGGHGRSSAYGSYGGSGAFGGQGGSSGYGGHRGSSGVGGYWESSGIEGSSGFGSIGGVKGHRRSDRVGGRGGTSDIGVDDVVITTGGKGGGRGRGKGGAKVNDGDEGIGDSDSGSDVGGEGGDGGSGIEGKKAEGGVATVGKPGLLQNMRSLYTKLYDYWGPVGLWNLALVMLLLGYYGKSYFWDTTRGRGYSTGGAAPHELGKNIKCPPKKKKNRTPCCESCTCCTSRPRILKHRLKWPDGPNL